jgi:hypothetical protein
MEPAALQKLIMMGKVTRTVKVGEFTFEMETTPLVEFKGETANEIAWESLVAVITKINGDPYVTPEQKKALHEMLPKLQGAIITKLLTEGREMMKESSDFVEGVSSKKS